MYVRFWGTRGSIATPGRRTVKYGGNTPCIEVRAGDDTRIILDCGTGARELGLDLMSTGSRPFRLHMFIGHTHWDHIQGFPFFLPAFLPDTEMNIYAPAGFQRNLEEAMAGQMQYSYFPVKLRDLRSRIHFTELEEGFFRVGDVLVETQHANHTAPTLAYRITSGGASVVYVSDHEPFWKPTGPAFHHPGDQRHIAFLEGADLVIHDAQYVEDEYASRLGWGHSTVGYATDVALAANVGCLALFHHDPLRDDAAVQELEAHARARVTARGGDLEIFAAAEGLGLEVRGSRLVSSVADVSALRSRPIAGRRVLLVSANEDDTASIEQVLTEDGLVLSISPDRRSALAQLETSIPDLVIVNGQLPDGDGAELVQPLRNRLGREDLPILLLADAPDVDATPRRAMTGAIDYLAKPFSPPMLRTRVRAWLARLRRTAQGLIDDGSIPPTEEATELGLALAGTSTTSGGGSFPGLVDALSSLPLFRFLSRTELEDLTRRATERGFIAGQIVVQQDDPVESVFVVLAGRVRVVEILPDLQQVQSVISELGPGEIVGELGVLTDQVRSATVYAVENTRCLVLPRAAFLQVLESSPELAVALLRVLAKRLADADRLLARYAPDPLTGLRSRRAFHDQYRVLAAGARRRQCGILLLLLDVVDLKLINDRFGYAVGDDVLRTVADALTEITRFTDLAARYRGDEFAVLLVDADLKAIDLVVARVQAKLAELAPRRGLPIEVQCSIGVAVSQDPPETADLLIWQADQDMHQRRERAVEVPESASR